MDHTTELTDYKCANCGSEAWRLAIGHRSDGTTHLIIICYNNECVEKRRKEMGVSESALILWDELDITGQGHDMVDHYQCDPKELN